MPTLSVFIGTYNKADYIADVLESVLNQSFQPIEIIVTDDCSTDEGWDIIQNYAQMHPALIKVSRNEQNLGAVETYNSGVKQAVGEYIYMMGADDNIFPDFFAKSMETLEQHPQAALCTSDPAQFFQENGVFLDNHIGWSEFPRYFTPDEFADVLNGWYIPAHPTIIKRKILLESGIHDPKLKWHSDWFFWLVTAFRYGLCYIPEPLACIRVAKTSYSGGRNNWVQQREVLVNILKMLKSEEFRDVLPYFVQGSALSHFHDDIVKAVMSEPDLWDNETMMLIQNPLWEWNQKLAGRQNERMTEFENSITEYTLDNSIYLGKSAYRNSRIDEAELIFTRLANQFPNNPEIYRSLAEVKAVKGESNDALNLLNMALKINPDSPDIFNLMGIIYFNNDDFKAAESSFMQSLTMDAGNADVMMNLAKIKELAGDVEKALAYLKQAESINPDHQGIKSALQQLNAKVN